jgi:hypothetical protein
MTLGGREKIQSIAQKDVSFRQAANQSSSSVSWFRKSVQAIIDKQFLPEAILPGCGACEI